MARSMIKRRQEAARERIEAYEATLRRVSPKARPAPDFEKAITEARRGFINETVRAGDGWSPRLKTRNPARLRLAAARHLFAVYPVPEPLERIWLDDAGLEEAEVRLRKRWYVIVARGGSLYKEAARSLLTKKQVHRFLNPPGRLSFTEAFWHAIAGSFTGDGGIALRIARSKIGRTPRAELAFWRDVARFFAVNPVSLEEIDDLCDFLAARHRRDRGWSLDGRTLASVRRLAAEWHRDVAAVARIEAARRRFVEAERHRGGADRGEGGRWKGAAIADWSWQPSGKDARYRKEAYAFVQLRSAEDLVHESRIMHHCVWTYAAKCISGQASIWSMRHVAAGQSTRLLTIELDRGNRAVQVRGFANRTAKPDERKVLERWARARGIHLPA
ncbi:hypothetical protein CSC94_06620 [Zhengella mangrovi]|uniref:PcfJ-like protein n=1 Tax=Zhengella mangrovi TaxID=1982044 RepID=A0A2G1QS04_9HYPH|nr:PcfJ domain-containing protein [Zhengella mangrovi]PHP68316.1 hypothetical protein CSC94_06620 [Zhengella mangrovi]